MPYQPSAFNFRTSSGTDLASLNLGWITKDYLISVYPQIAGQLITPELWIWGVNGSRQLGDNTAVNRSTPVTTFAGGSNWREVSAGYNPTAAIKTDGTLWIWGKTNADNTGNNRSTPITTFAGGTNWNQVACGHNHTAAIKTDGTLWAWGFNSYGGLGNNISIFGGSQSTPLTTFAGGTNWKQVSCGKAHTAAVKTDGTLWTWGRNSYGQLGDNTTTNRCTPVTTFAGGTNWKQVSCGWQHTSAIKTDGTLWVWGSNSYGQIGDNTTTNRCTPITTFAGGTNWKQVACGGYHTTAVKTDGTLWTWGAGGSGQLGNNTAVNRSTPVTTFAGGTSWKQVAGGRSHTAVIKTDGTLWVWGRSTEGQLGINSTIAISTPVTTFAGGSNWKQVSSSGYTTVAIKTSDDLQGI